MDSAGHHSHTMETSRHSNTTRRPRGGTWLCSRPGAVRLPFCPQHQTAAVPSPDVPMATLAGWHWEWVHPSLGLLSAMCTPSTHPGKSIILGCMEYLSCNAKRTRLGVLGGRAGHREVLPTHYNTPFLSIQSSGPQGPHTWALGRSSQRQMLYEPAI